MSRYLLCFFTGMDKSWLSQKRNTREYIDGVEGFFELANKKLGKDNLKPCPCLQCLNLFERSNSEIRFHLYSIGIDLTYTRWTSHSESKFIDGSDNDYLHEGDHHFDTDEPDDFMITKEMIEAAQEQYFGDPNKFHELFHDADKPLYEGCTKYTMLSTVVKI